MFVLTGISCFAVTGTNVFVGTAGVYLSMNNGKGWKAINPGLKITGVKCLAVSETNLFAGSDSGVWPLALSDGGIK